ncbi:hypothetical protein V8F06_011675 [Rhypophila decipiens]
MNLKILSLVCAAGSLVTGAPSQDLGDGRQVPITPSLSEFASSNHGQKVPGESPAYFCPDSDPADNIFNVTRLDFLPTNPRVGFYQKVRLIGHFVSPTGDVPWMTVNTTYLDKDLPGNNPFFWGPLCDIDVLQEISVPIPDSEGGGETRADLHRSCPEGIREGYAVLTSWPIPLFPGFVPTGRFHAKAEAITQDGRRIFCVEGTFEVTD